VVLGIAAQVWASGWPPFPSPDFATVARGGVVDRLSNGNLSVLDNDIDFEGDDMTAVLHRDVKHGVLELRPDGTFTYEHNGNNKDEDTFEYRAYDGTRHSRRTRVTIEIEATPNNPPVVIGDVPDQEAIEDVYYELNLAEYFVDPDDGDELRFSADGLPGSRSLRINSSTGVLSGTPENRDARETPYSVVITARDLAGAEATLSFLLTIYADDRADMELTISLAANPVTVGETAQWNIEMSNKGPGELEAAELSASWTTSGPALNLSAPQPCTFSGNDTSAPEMTCAIGSIPASQSLTIQVDGTMGADGENSLIGMLLSDDPIPGNNTDLVSSQVVAEFSEGPAQVVNVSGNGVDAGDVNGDGEVDIVSTDGQTYIFLNDGNRSVTTPGVSLGPDSGGSAVTLLDWNGDSSTDIAVGGLSGRAAEIFVNDGSGNFSSAGQLPSTGVGSVNDMVAADLNNSGRSDLVVAGSLGTLVLRSRSEGGFEQLSLSSGAGLDVATADVDLDGDRDIIVVRQSDRAVDIHYNTGDATSFNRVRHDYGSVATVGTDDLNGDGLPDLMLAVDGDDLNPPQSKVYLQQSDGTFSSGGTFGAAPVTSLLAGDVDIDGWPDVVAVNEAGVHQLYLGSGSGFSLAPEQIVSNGMKRGVLADFNNDQSLDLIMVGRDASVLEIHANND
jgi:VCBS repeat-containing protein